MQISSICRGFFLAVFLVASWFTCLQFSLLRSGSLKCVFLCDVICFLAGFVVCSYSCFAGCCSLYWWSICDGVLGADLWQDGKGEVAYQYRGHWTCRLRQVHHHRSSHLQVGGYRQESDRAIWEGGCRDEQALFQVRVGAGQAEGWAGAWYHNRYCAVEVRDYQVLLYCYRCSWASWFHQEHDHRYISSWLRCSHHRLHHRRFWGWYFEGWTDPGTRTSRLHSWRQADDLLLQ